MNISNTKGDLYMPCVAMAHSTKCNFNSASHLLGSQGWTKYSKIAQILKCARSSISNTSIIVFREIKVYRSQYMQSTLKVAKISTFQPHSIFHKLSKLINQNLCYLISWPWNAIILFQVAEFSFFIRLFIDFNYPHDKTQSHNK